MKRRVSRKAQEMANQYVATRSLSIKEGSTFEIYTNGRTYTFSFKLAWGGYWVARFEHYGHR